MNVVHHLMRYPPIVLQHVVIVQIGGFGDLPYGGHDLCELIIGDVGELRAVVLRDDEGMPDAQWLNIQESKDLFGFVDLEGWDFTFDDFAEDAGGGHCDGDEV